MNQNPKQLGAIQMFEQSIVYLYNSYREDGMNADEAKSRVAKHIEETHAQYQQINILPKDHHIGLSRPEFIIDDLIKSIDVFDWDAWRQLAPTQKESTIKHQFHQIAMKAKRLKKLL